jgi:hypothetical protein
MKIETRAGLHYIEGLPSGVEYVYRGVTFVLCIVAAGMALGILRARREVHPGLWWVALFCFGTVALRAIVALERWVVPVSIENLVATLTVPALRYGMWLRAKDGTIGR